MGLVYIIMTENLFLLNSHIEELDEKNSPGHLDQIELFYEDTDELFSSMTEIITASQLAVTYATANKESARQLNKTEPAGYLLKWPDAEAGLSTVIASQENGSCNSLAAVFPFIIKGTTIICRLTGIRLFYNRLEAQLRVLAGDEELLELTFYDIHYLYDRTVYQENGLYQFVIRAFAYHFEINDDPEKFSAAFPRADLGADHYEIQGPVYDIEQPQFAMLQQKITILKVSIAQNPDGTPVLLDVIISGKVMGKQPAPRPGQCINAVIWLQGHLWGTAE